MLSLTLISLAAFASHASAASEHWVDVWGSMPQLTEPANLPPAPYNQTGVVFRDATLRQTVQIRLAASTIRLQFSNAFGGSDLPITAVTVGLPVNGSAGVAGVQSGSVKEVTFSRGSKGFIIPPGAVALSDPIEYPVKDMSMITVSTYLATGQAGNAITSHPGSRTTSWLAPGDQTVAAAWTDSAVAKTDHWYLLSTIEARLPKTTRSLAVIGDSITDGRGTTTNGNNRWPDILQSRLNGAISPVYNPIKVSVINQAAGGNRILNDGLGPNALGRIERDVLAHGASYALIFEGVNDIGTAGTDAASQSAVGDRIIGALEQMITRLHAREIAVFGATITPFCGAGVVGKDVVQGYCELEREKTRLRVNKWIRESGRFDAVVDFDEVVRDKSNATALLGDFDTNDHLHLNPAGYKAMGEAVDLGLFDRFKDGVSGLT